MYIKRIPLSERSVDRTRLEADLQRKASAHGFSPKIHRLIETDTDVTIEMDDLGAPCLADAYGKRKIPKRIWKQIYKILDTLLKKEKIEYVDITPYNFIEKDKKIYIIDFGDAKIYEDGELNWFLKQFLDGDCGWNPDFA